MIVNKVNEGWEIFSHSSHGLLAGKIANEIEDQYKCFELLSYFNLSGLYDNEGYPKNPF